MSSGTNLSPSLFTLMKEVSEALTFDKQERIEDAYKKYLQCVLKVSSSLLKSLVANDGHVLVTTELEKMVKLGQQCMNRVEGLVSDRLEKAPKQKNQAPTSLYLCTGPGPPKPWSQTTPTTPASKDPSPASRDTTPTVSSIGIPGKLGQTGFASLKVSDVGSASLGNTRNLSPLTIAAMKNQQLLIALRKRQGQTKDKTASISLGLTVQRKMAENLAIAKAQDQALKKKLQERQRRLEEQAAKRFLTPVGLSEEEQYQRQVYKRVLEFEQENGWMLDLRKKFEEAPTDITIIGELIMGVLKCGAHPLTDELQKALGGILQKIARLVNDRLEYVDAIRVPLSRDILGKSGLKQFVSSFGRSSSGMKLSQSDTKLHTVHEEDTKSHSLSDQSKKVKESADSSVCSDIPANKSYSDSDIFAIGKSSLPEQDLADVNEEIKSDVEKALRRGDILKSKLEEENKKLNVLSRQLTEDYEKYNQENMDDLFDEDEDVDDDADVEDKKEEEIEKDEEEKKDEDEAEKVDTAAAAPEVPSQKKDGVEEGPNHEVESHEGEKEDKVEISSSAEGEQDSGTSSKSEGADDFKTTNSAQKTLKRNPSFSDLETRIAELKNNEYYHHLKKITDEILTSIERIHVLFVIVFEKLDSAEGRDQCNVLIEGYFFKPLWRNLLALFRLANEPKEVALASFMTANQTSLPEAFNVREILCLGSEESGVYPYQPAVVDLVAVTQCDTMLEKLDCLVRSSKQVMQCVEEFYKRAETESPSLGADDLLPILCYIVVRSGLPQLVSECQAMERFIHEGYMFGEEGYCLTSFQTAINYLISEGLSMHST